MYPEVSGAGSGSLMESADTTDRGEGTPIITCGLFSLLLVIFLLIRQHQLLLRAEIGICAPKAMHCPLLALHRGLVQVWALAGWTGCGTACLPCEAYKATDVSKFSELCFSSARLHPLGAVCHLLIMP